MPTHFKGPLYGDARADGGVLRNAPIDLTAKPHNIVYFNDFTQNSDYDATNDWVLTNATSGTAATSSNAVGGRLVLSASTADQGIVSLQLASTAGTNKSVGIGLATPAAASSILFPSNYTAGVKDDRTIHYEACIAITGSTVPRWAVGLSEVSTSFMTAATGALVASKQKAVFRGVGSLTYTLDYMGQDNSAKQATLLRGAQSAISAVSTMTRFGIKIVGTSTIYWYVNGQLVAQTAMASAFNAGMAITFAMVCAGSVASSMLIDYVMTSCDR